MRNFQTQKSAPDTGLMDITAAFTGSTPNIDPKGQATITLRRVGQLCTLDIPALAISQTFVPTNVYPLPTGFTPALPGPAYHPLWKEGAGGLVGMIEVRSEGIYLSVGNLSDAGGSHATWLTNDPHPNT